MKLRKDEAELFDRPQSAGDAAIAEEGDRLAVPRLGEEIDEEFQEAVKLWLYSGVTRMKPSA